MSTALTRTAEARGPAMSFGSLSPVMPADLTRSINPTRAPPPAKTVATQPPAAKSAVQSEIWKNRNKKWIELRRRRRPGKAQRRARAADAAHSEALHRPQLVAVAANHFVAGPRRARSVDDAVAATLGLVGFHPAHGSPLSIMKMWPAPFSLMNKRIALLR